jgi:hypothetical protein
MGSSSAASRSGRAASVGSRSGWRRPLKIALICDPSWDYQANIIEHMDAFSRYSAHQVYRLNPRRWVRPEQPDLDHFDVVVIHYSIWILQDYYLPDPVRDAIRSFSGLKVQFLQDEYRRVNDTVDALLDLGIDVLFTLCSPVTCDALYGRLRENNVRLETTLTGYVPRALSHARTKPIAQRAVHVAYRTRELPFSLGALSQQKVEIGKRFAELAPEYGLTCDIGWRLEDRIYGRDWMRFQASTKAALGTGSGASITDFDGTLESRVEEYVAEHPKADFEEVSRKILQPYEGNVMMEVISPRVFEAAALRTALVLYPGEYSGVIEPERHFIPLERDFSNMDEVAQRLLDNRYLQELVDRTYDEIVDSGRYTYRAFIAEFDAVVETEHQARVLSQDSMRPAHGGRPEIGRLSYLLRTPWWRTSHACARGIWSARLIWQWRYFLVSGWLDVKLHPVRVVRGWIAFHTRLVAAVTWTYLVDGQYRRVAHRALRWRSGSLRERLQAVLQAARVTCARRHPLQGVSYELSELEQPVLAADANPSEPVPATMIRLVHERTGRSRFVLLDTTGGYALPALSRLARDEPLVARLLGPR